MFLSFSHVGNVISPLSWVLAMYISLRKVKIKLDE